MTRPRKKSRRKRDSNLGPSALEADALTTRPTRRYPMWRREKNKYSDASSPTHDWLTLQFLVTLNQFWWPQELEDSSNNKNNDNDRNERHNSRFFYNLAAPQNCLQQVCSSGQGASVYKSRATHRALIMGNMLCAIGYKGTAQLLSLTELKSHSF